MSGTAVTALVCASAVVCGTLAGTMLTRPATVPVLEVGDLCEESGLLLATVTPRTGATADPLAVALAGREACRRMQAETRERIAAARYRRPAMERCVPGAENYTRLEACLEGRPIDEAADGLRLGELLGSLRAQARTPIAR